MVERAAHNGFVVGSIPTKPKNKKVKFTIKTYKLSKIKKHFKKSHFFFLYNTITPKNNIKTTQELKKLDLKYYKLYNTLTRQTLKNSIYQNYQPLINGLVMLVLPRTTINLNTLAHLNDIVTLTGIKINNKIYSTKQINPFIKFEYVKDYTNLVKTIKSSLKQLKNFSLN